MTEWLGYASILLLYFVVMKWVLPRFGVAT
jgi:hypothetical protein